MAEDIVTALRALANRWAMKARDFARAAKDESENEAQASYNRGYAEGYYKAATELAQLLKEQGEAQPPKPAAPPPPQGGRRFALPQAQPAAAPAVQPAAPRPAAAPTVMYASISVGEVLSILSYAGCSARDVTQNKDNSFHAVFSRWENMMPHERLERIQKTDNRIIILANGKLESHDHFIDFAFKDD